MSTPEERLAAETYRRRVERPIMLNLRGWAVEVFGSRIYVVKAVYNARSLKQARNIFRRRFSTTKIPLPYPHPIFFQTRLGAIRAAKKLMRSDPRHYTQIIAQT